MAQKFQLRIGTVMKDVRRAIDVLMGHGVKFHKRSWCVMGKLDMKLYGDIVEAKKRKKGPDTLFRCHAPDDERPPTGLG